MTERSKMNAYLVFIDSENTPENVETALEKLKEALPEGMEVIFTESRSYATGDEGFSEEDFKESCEDLEKFIQRMESDENAGSILVSISGENCQLLPMFEDNVFKMLVSFDELTRAATGGKLTGVSVYSAAVSAILLKTVDNIIQQATEESSEDSVEPVSKSEDDDGNGDNTSE